MIFAREKKSANIALELFMLCCDATVSGDVPELTVNKIIYFCLVAIFCAYTGDDWIVGAVVYRANAVSVAIRRHCFVYLFIFTFIDFMSGFSHNKTEFYVYFYLLFRLQ